MSQTAEGYCFLPGGAIRRQGSMMWGRRATWTGMWNRGDTAVMQEGKGGWGLENMGRKTKKWVKEWWMRRGSASHYPWFHCDNKPRHCKVKNPSVALEGGRGKGKQQTVRGREKEVSVIWFQLRTAPSPLPSFPSLLLSTTARKTGMSTAGSGCCR